jgi:hypothetical protein
MIKIFSYNDCSPELIELQVDSFRKHLKDDFEFIMFTCEERISTTPEKSREVVAVCNSLGVRVIEVPRDADIEANWYYGGHVWEDLFRPDGRLISGAGGVTFGYMQQWSWQRVICQEKGNIAVVHSDIFLIEPVNFTNHLSDHELCAVKNTWQKGITGFWEPLLLADMSKMPDPETIVWWPSTVEGQWTDSGGRTYYYLKAHPNLRWLEIGQDGCYDDAALDFHPARYAYFLLGDKKVLHYQSASGWATDRADYLNFSKEKSAEYHARKRSWTRKLIDGVIKPDRSCWRWQGVNY